MPITTTITGSPQDPPRRVDLAAGEVREIDLPGLGTAGYVWQHELDGDSAAIEVTWRRGPLPKDALSTAVGASAPEVVTIRALQPGKVHLRLKQRRPWEADARPLHSHDVEVHVAPPHQRPAETE
ncbi:MAG: protease inhibitor I42 family protein [Solirubrobacterales bacterium]